MKILHVEFVILNENQFLGNTYFRFLFFAPIFCKV